MRSFFSMMRPYRDLKSTSGAIGCLSEFDTSISDNVKQLDLYTEACVEPLIARDDLAERLDAACVKSHSKLSPVENSTKKFEEFKALVNEVGDQRETLVNLRGQFRSRLETVKALRDGVSPISSVVASRTIDITSTPSNFMANL